MHLDEEEENFRGRMMRRKGLEEEEAEWMLGG